MTTYTPRLESITGASLTGSNGTQNRTYSLIHANSISAQMSIIVDGTPFQYGQHYTKSGDTITFINNVWDDMPITITYLTEISGTASSGDLRYTTVLGLIEHVHALKTIPNKDNTSYEEVGTGDGSTTSFWLDNIGVIEDTYTLYHGTGYTELAESTHYDIDLDTSEITLTSAGVTEVGTDKIYAKYKYNLYEISNDELRKVLSSSERKFERDTGVVFADYTDNTPDYVKILNEIKYWELYDKFYTKDKVLEFNRPPSVKLNTTVASAYTTGDTEITLTSGTGFPTSGATIYIGGNKVTYTARTNNVLTIPASTPSIDADSVVVGEVIEISREPEGSDPSWTVLDPDTEYNIDHDDGTVKLLRNAFFGELSANDLRYPSNVLIRVSYMHAWHDYGQNPNIPDDIVEACYMIGAKKLVQRMIKKAHILGNDGFQPNAINSGDTEIQETIMKYQTLNVGRSVYDSGRLT